VPTVFVALVNVMSRSLTQLTSRTLLLCSLLLLSAVPAKATEYFDMGLHGRVQASDIVVVARVVDLLWL
jgi:hypothetical protein